ncbi:hypothetical protein [Pseudomonas putida]|uniref:Uncharacterized protein n=1 Tax=Pseudomonas putida TaxID=303 RepID=A0A1Q9R7S8_PSEPU|nr:hypothetical protein [Pseudomonas putida]OLS63421.1 hypothetical protein PSEMO_15600 [Pseudomonas putida]
MTSSRQSCSDAERTQLMDAAQRVLVGWQPSAEQQPVEEKLVKLMQERFKGRTT